MRAAAQSTSKLIASYLDAVMQFTHPEHHSYRSASIGLTEAALRDGKNVKIRSMVMAAAKEKAAVPRSNTKGNPTEPLMRREAGHDRATPRILPLSASAAVSTVI